VEIANDGPLGERRAALLALVEADEPRAADAVVRAALDDSPYIRAAAARWGSDLMTEELLEQLERDATPMVRSAALRARLDRPGDREAVIQRFLEDPDGGVRAAALTWLGENPILPVQSLAQTLSGSGREVLGLSLRAVDALLARAVAEPSERGTIVAVLERLAGVHDFLIRQQAIAALGDLGRPLPELGQVESRRSVDVYRNIVQRTVRPRRLRFATSRGSFDVELHCSRAPLSCLHFVQLAAQGFYDGLLFHRVLPAFLVESGDPRGDGWGGPGFRVRDEPGPSRIGPGSVVLSRAQPHSAGSRFSVLLEERPDLEGSVTVIGTVVDGLDVVLEIGLGDEILSVVDISGTS
jgi:cyclophilin family peptidyl-prolyl cis-trans isomerase